MFRRYVWNWNCYVQFSVCICGVSLISRLIWAHWSVVKGSNHVQSLLPALESLNWAPSLYGNQPRCCRTPPSTSLPPSLPLLVWKRSIVWNIDIALQYVLRVGPTVGFRSQGAPHAHALQHALLWRLSCHCETPTLGCLCQQWPCALSLSVLFMGTREVARRVAGSGRAFLQHCSLYAALNQREFLLLGWLGLHQLFRRCHVFI